MYIDETFYRIYQNNAMHGMSTAKIKRPFVQGFRMSMASGKSVLFE